MVVVIVGGSGDDGGGGVGEGFAYSLKARPRVPFAA